VIILGYYYGNFWPMIHYKNQVKELEVENEKFRVENQNLKKEIEELKKRIAELEA
jgi:FKBP-type peptidyl-prolyl cis-trans isomerase (trigger factor)